MAKDQGIESIAKPLPPAPPILDLQQQNLTFLGLLARRMREIVLDGQQRRADGRIVIEAHMNAGVLTGSISNGTKWHERLNR